MSQNSSQDVIELNGKRYDARTGEMLGKSSVVPAHIMVQHGHGRVIDGFMRPAKPAEPTVLTHTKPALKVPETKPVAKPAAHHAEAKPDIKRPAKPHRNAAAHAVAHHPQSAKTLMRRAVHKPEHTLKPAIKTQAPAEIMAKPHSALVHKHSAASVDPVRKERAAQVGKHETIRHFLPADRPIAMHTTTAHVPVIAVRAAPQPVKRAEHHAPHRDIFEAAMHRATSHEQPAHKPRKHHSSRRRLVNTMAVVAAFLVIGGFIGYLNMPTIGLRVASFQAGFGATMPGYTPTGYALDGGAKRIGGTVSLSFRSGASSYVITQQASNWNSQTLLDNTLALNGPHDTIEKNGQTVYVYGDGLRAAWVNGGVRYDITGNAELSKEDVTAIATSL